ncbi:MAG: hypothetical protein HN348_34960, partial [Proteobacteria bacterium]|nr:hypothetical protein [Pseudomonadota bacterium]
MSELDPIRLSKTMAFLLRHRPEVGNLKPDGEGWVECDALCQALGRLLHEDVAGNQVQQVVSSGQRFEIHGTRIRAVKRSKKRKQSAPPDILFHATTQTDLARFRQQGRITSPKKKVCLSTDEAHAWRVAHRMSQEPALIYVDAGRANRQGVRFYRNRRNGLYVASPIPTQFAMNLQPNFGQQLSAGGIPII